MQLAYLDLPQLLFPVWTLIINWLLSVDFVFKKILFRLWIIPLMLSSVHGIDEPVLKGVG